MPERVVRAVRDLLEAVRRSDLTAAGPALGSIEAGLRELKRALEPYEVDGVPTQIGLRHSSPRLPPDQVASQPDGVPIGWFPYSPVTGSLNPVAPPIRLWKDGDTIRGAGSLPVFLNGPPAGAHGGVVAAVLDELLGMATVARGYGGFTGTLTITYLQPTPIQTELELAARVVEVDGRRVTATGEISADGSNCASARGVFVRPVSR